MAAPAELTKYTSGTVAWYLAITRLNAVRRRVEREGLTAQSRDAFVEGIADLTNGLVEILRERGVTS